MTEKTIDQEMLSFEQKKQQAKVEKEIHEEGSLVEAKACRDMTPQASEIFQAAALHERARIFGGMRRLFSAAEIKAIKEIKDSKSFKHIEINDGEKFRLCGNFTEYCRFAIGRSHGIVYEEIQNFDIFGEAIDGMKSMGVERNDFRLLRKAPDDLLGEARQAAEADDKDALLEIIDDLAVKHAKEKEELNKQNTDLKGSLEAAQDFAGKKNERINELEEKLHRKSLMKPSERAEELSNQLEVASGTARGFLNSVESTIKEIVELDECPRDLRHACAHAMVRIRVRMDEIHTTYGIERMDVDVGMDDSWMAELPAVSGEVTDYDAE
ncbi:MAG: hypothetical protein RPU14_03870 [Candidatus Sedimenticola sp. (ex Thyasira tokunagai)]